MSTTTLNHGDYQPLTQTDQLQHHNKADPLEEYHLFSAQEELPPKSQEISTWRLTLNLINVMEGSGFLALPFALHEGGITAVVAFCVLPFIMVYSGNLITQCLDDKDEYGGRIRKRWTYQEIAMHCWAPFKYLTWLTITAFIVFCLAAFIVLCGSLMSQQFPHVPITESQWACLGTLLVFPTVFLKQLSQIAWISLISAIALITATAVALSYEFQEIQSSVGFTVAFLLGYSWCFCSCVNCHDVLLDP